MDAKTAGLRIGGLVMNKTTFKNKLGEVNYNIHVAMPGASVNIQVSVSIQRYQAIEIMSEYVQNLTVSEYGGKTYFAERV